MDNAATSLGDRKLPPELEREIFEIAATLHIETIPALLCVAHRVLIWINPFIYKTLVFSSQHTSRFPAAVQTIQRKTDSFIQENTRNIMWWGTDDEQAVCTLFSICVGVQNLALWGLSRSVLPLFARLRLRRLSLPADAPWSPGSDPFYAAITHLHLHSYHLQQTPVYYNTGRLPSLSHLCVDSISYVARPPLRRILEECKKLEVLVCMFHNQRTLKVSSTVTRATGSEIDDPRIVTMVMDDGEYVKDWKVGAAGGRDFWVRAEEIIAKRRSGPSIRM
ncbi:hypothetical protein C8R44DRAFT_889065 [Mycena epipterygia]|nr:hypothetical protein C8R44DRAFT_889065 [Mycena epipterygia]